LSSHRLRQLTVLVLLVMLAQIALAKMAQGLVTILSPHRIELFESVIYAHAGRMSRGEALYHPSDQLPFSFPAYMPLYYALAAALQAVVGPGFTSGRLLSYVSGLAAAATVGYLTKERARSVLAGTLAAFLFLALGFAEGGPWYARYRVDVLGVALSFGAIAVLTHGHDRGHLLASGLLAALSLLTKQTMFAAALAGAIWLWPIETRKAVLFAVTVATLVLIPSLLFEATTHAFFSNVIGSNIIPTSKEYFTFQIRLYAQSQLLPFLLAAAWAVFTRPWRRKSSTGLLFVYWCVSAITLAGLGKIGAGHNYWIEFAGASSVLATLGLWSALAPQHVHRTSANVVYLGLTALFVIRIALLLPTIGWATLQTAVDQLRSRPDPQIEAGYINLLTRVKNEHGMILADPLDVIGLAEKSVLLEPFVPGILEKIQRWDSKPVVRMICAGEVGLVALAYPLEYGALIHVNGYEWWPPAVMAALQQKMIPAGMEGERYLYVPRGVGSELLVNGNATTTDDVCLDSDMTMAVSR
jgi:hypothetical protein